MKNQFLKLVAVFGIVLLIASCKSQSKTVEADAPTAERRAEGPPSDTKKPRGERPQGGQRPQGGKREKPSFDKLLADMDKNKDGKLSKDEVQGPLKNDFAKVDKNKDGFITADEFKNLTPPRPPRGGQN